MIQLIGALFTWQFWVGALVAGILMYFFKDFIDAKVQELKDKNTKKS